MPPQTFSAGPQTASRTPEATPGPQAALPAPALASGPEPALQTPAAAAPPRAPFASGTASPAPPASPGAREPASAVPAGPSPGPSAPAPGPGPTLLALEVTTDSLVHPCGGPPGPACEPRSLTLFPRRAPLWLHWAGPGPEAWCCRGWRSPPGRLGRVQWTLRLGRGGSPRGAASSPRPACPGREERSPAPPAPCLARCSVTCTLPGKGTWPPGCGLLGAPAVSPGALKCPRVLVRQFPCTPAQVCECMHVCGADVRACVVCVTWGVSAQAWPPRAPPHLASVHLCSQAECVPLTWQRVTCAHLQGTVTAERWGRLGLSVGPSVDAAGGEEGRPRDRVSCLTPSSAP